MRLRKLQSGRTQFAHTMAQSGRTQFAHTVAQSGRTQFAHTNMYVLVLID
jgi:hypothetical protein